MLDQTSNPLQGRTVIGTFTETWDAESALEDLKFAGHDGYIRYVKHEDHGQVDDTRIAGGFNSYFAKIHGFESQDEFQDSDGTFTVNPDAEEYFSETFTKKLHIILVQTQDTLDKAIDIIHMHHGKVEIKHWSFFNAMVKDEHRVDGETFQEPPRIHPTQAIVMPREESL